MNIKLKKLLELLEKAEILAAQYSGGISYEFNSAEAFHSALQKRIDLLKNGDQSQLKKIYYWFLPTACWDDFIGMEGKELADEIISLMDEINYNSKS